MENPALPQIVEIRQHGDVIAVAALEEQGGRLRGVDVAGRWTRFPAARVLCFTGVAVPGAEPERAVEALRAYVEEQERRRAGIDLETLWELARDEAATASLEGLTELLFPGGDGRDRAAVLRAVVGDGLRFRVRADDIEVRSAERVAALRHERDEARRREELRAQVVRWLQGGRPEPPAGADRWIEHLRQLAAAQAQPPARDPGVALLRDARMRATPAAAFRVLRQRGVFGEHENLHLIRHGLGRPFPRAVLDEARELAAAPLGAAPRRDLRTLRAVSIDDEETTEVDDALTLQRREDGGVRVGVHLAEPGARIPPGSRVDREAARRQTTLYLPDGKHLMLPPELAEQACSLAPEEERPALTVWLDYDAAGRETGFEVETTLIRVSEAVPYDVADARLEAGSDPMLASLARLAGALRRSRIDDGALETAVVEVHPVVGLDGEVMLQEFHPDTPSRKLVAEWMVRANHAAARLAWERGVPMPYRYQELRAPFPAGLDLTDRYDVYRATRCLAQTRMDLTPRRHHGLGLDAYVQITSPLRRYLDLVAQRQLAAAARGAPPPLDAEALEAAMRAATQGISRAQITSAATREYWMIRWLEGQLDEEFDAVVLEEQGDRVRIELLDLGLRLPWKPLQTQRVGERIRLRLVDADARAGHVRLHWGGGLRSSGS